MITKLVGDNMMYTDGDTRKCHSLEELERLVMEKR